MEQEDACPSTNSEELQDVNTECQADVGLRMSPEHMLDLAKRAAELVVDRIESLPEQDAWDGEFREDLTTRFMKDAPEHGSSAAEVMEWAARDILGDYIG